MMCPMCRLEAVKLPIQALNSSLLSYLQHGVFELESVLIHAVSIIFTGGPGLEPPYRPRVPINNHQKIMPTRPSYPGMMPNLQGGMGMMGMDNKQYPIGFKPQPAMPQGQILRQQLQVRLVSLITDIKTPETKKHQLREILIKCWPCSLHNYAWATPEVRRF